MNLEDHLGDIIRKARGMSNVSTAIAAKAASISEVELSALEDSGQFSKRPNFIALAQAIGLNGAKLESIAAGWLPKKKDLTAWRHFQMLTSMGDGMTVNCFLIWDEAMHQAALFDTGFDADVILKTITQEKLNLGHIFITHSHPDHVAALGGIRKALPHVQIRSCSQHAPASQRLQPGEIFSVGSLRISYRETPGHAADGVTYIITGWSENAPAVAVVGDTIFAASMGRGNDGWDLAKNKVREQILTLPPETLLCPGHGPLTTVVEESDNNPFF